jgi:hypothetical protein
MLGPVPLIVGFGYHPRGYTYKATGDFAVEADYQIDMVDFWATVPYPVSDRAILQAGFLVGTCLGGKRTIDDDDTDIEDIEGEPDFGIMLGGGFAITEQVGVNCAYYIGLAEFDDQTKFNGLIFNLGYTLSSGHSGGGPTVPLPPLLSSQPIRARPKISTITLKIFTYYLLN